MTVRAALIRVEPNIEPFVDEYLHQMQMADIVGPKRMAFFFGQCWVESGGFKRVRESLDYATNSTMMARFIQWGRITPAQAEQYGRNAKHAADQKALANILYGGKWGQENLGNIHENDGWDFRGGGHKQLTGRRNYQRFSAQYFGDDRMIKHPELIEQPKEAVASAVWFWGYRRLNQTADKGSVEAVTLKVNGGTVGIDKRVEWTNKFLSALS